MNRLFAIAPAALAALSLASVANAGAVAGTYSGASADGNSVSFTVGNDANNVLAVLSETVFFSALCNEGTTLNTGWGLGLDVPITGSKVTNTFAFTSLTTAFGLKFSADGQSATGMIHSTSSTLDPVGPKPTEALFCKSAPQRLSVTLQPPPARVGPSMHGVVYLGKVAKPAS